VKVEGCADPNEHRALDLTAVFRHPLFLLGATEADPDNIWFGFVDARDSCGCFHRAQRAERRTFDAGHL
jgi:hypothetical protein